MAHVAWIGLGVMGSPMAGHLLKKGGHDVVAYNRNEAKAKAWVAEYGGAQRADAGRSRRRRRNRILLRRQRRRPAGRDDRRERRLPRYGGGHDLRRPHDGFGRGRTRTQRCCLRARLLLPRRARLRRPGRGAERGAHGDDGRRRAGIRARKAVHLYVCPLPSIASDRRAPVSSPRWSTRCAIAGMLAGARRGGRLRAERRPRSPPS